MTSRTVGIDLAIRGAHVATVLDAQGAVLGAPLRFHMYRTRFLGHQTVAIHEHDAFGSDSA